MLDGRGERRARGSLLPQFGGSFWGLLALGLLFCALTLAWLAAYSVAVAHAGDVLRRPGIRRSLEAITGTLLVAFGDPLGRRAPMKSP